MRKSGARGCGRVRAVPMVFRRGVVAHCPPVNEHLFAWMAGLFAAMVAVIAGAVATRVRLLPEVIDVSIIPTGAGLGSLGFAFYGALRRYEPDRIGRLTLLGTLLGAATAAVGLVLGLMLDVLS
jgi:predicted benzoate:H+ symporter BenE